MPLGWAKVEDDEGGLGQLLWPAVATHASAPGRGGEGAREGGRALAALASHPALAIVGREHSLRGMPVVAAEDAIALLGAEAAALVPWAVRPLRGRAAALAATSRPPPPPDDYEPRPEGRHLPPATPAPAT